MKLKFEEPNVEILEWDLPEIMSDLLSVPVPPGFEPDDGLGDGF